MPRFLAAVVSLLAFVGCSEGFNHSSSPTEPPLLEIQDGANGGNDHFYFMPPMVPAPDPIGDFDSSLGPSVEICVWNIEESTCGASLEIYNMSTGPGSETVRLDEENELYVVNWHTAAIVDNVPLEEQEVIRIRVLVGSQELGHADVEVVGTAKELKNHTTNDKVMLLDGRTLPIKFRIEDGALLQGETVSAEGWHTCALTASGEAYCWGYNNYGQLGIGTHATTPPYAESTPQPVIGNHRFLSISAGDFHTCGVTVDGAAYCWGYNSYGELGTGTRNTSPPYSDAEPQRVVGGHVFEAVKPGLHSTCGVTTDGDAYCWGYNGHGELGTGDFSYVEPTPVKVTGNHDFRSITTERYSSCGVTTADEAYCWGYNGDGELGFGFISTTHPYSEPLPSPVAGQHEFLSVDRGAFHTCGVTTEGDAYCWGYNLYGELGNGERNFMFPFSEPTPLPVNTTQKFTQLSGGWIHTCGVASDGQAYCWGHNVHGQLGTGVIPPYYQEHEPSPVAVTGGHTFKSVSAGHYHSCGATTLNTAYCWGLNHYGQLGIGEFLPYPDGVPTPQIVLDLDPDLP